MILKQNKELKQNDFKSEKELQTFFENNIETILIRGILHEPVIIMAKAKNPIPFTSPLKVVLVNINIAPPSPANIEAIIIPIHWYLTTLIPCESAAFGFSPIDTNLKPNLVNLITTYKATIKAIFNIQKFVNPADTSTNDILRKLRAKLDAYRLLSGDDEIIRRNKLNNEIIEELQKLSLSFNARASKYNYNSETVKSILDYVNSVENIISKSSKGELQEILTAYKSILPRKEYLKLKSKVNSAIKSLDKAIDIETNQYFDKARDLRLGSAPTDVLSILITGGAVGYYLNKSENKDEKCSVAIKYGIPAIGAIATSLYCTARLVAGGKAILFGLISGWLMNKAGEIVDDARKKYSLDISLINKAKAKSQPDKV